MQEYRTKKEILKAIAQKVRGKILCCNDPMNGCPEDFAEDYDREINGLTIQAYAIGVSDQELERITLKATSRAYKEVEKIFTQS